MQAMKRLLLACVLFAGTAFGQDNAARELIEVRQLREAIHKQDFEQLLAASVRDPSQLPKSGTLEGASVTFLHDALKPKNAFKFATWVLCVAPTSHEDGTVLVIDSVQTLASDKGPRTVEVRYRPMKASGQHTTNKVWPYAVLVVKGVPDEVVCRPAQG